MPTDNQLTLFDACALSDEVYWARAAVGTVGSVVCCKDTLDAVKRVFDLAGNRYRLRGCEKVTAMIEGTLHDTGAIALLLLDAEEVLTRLPKPASCGSDTSGNYLPW